MFYTYQPQGLNEDGTVRSQLTPIQYKNKMYGEFNDLYFRYLNFGTHLRMELDGEDRDINSRAFMSLYLGGAIYDAFVAVRGYKNILVIPSWNDGNSRLTMSGSDSFLPYAGSAIHCFPLIHKYNETDGVLNIATVPNATSFFDYMYKHMANLSDNIRILRSDDYYVLGKDNFKIKGHPEEKYDAVILMDVPNYENETFRADVIKEDFAHLCTSDFDLIEFNTSPTLTRIKGQKDIRIDISKVLKIVTPDTLKKELLLVKDDETVTIERTTTMNSLRIQLDSLQSKIRVY